MAGSPKQPCPSATVTTRGARSCPILEFPGSATGPWTRYVHDANLNGIGTVRYFRMVPKAAACAEELKKRTLTNLYNQRPTWLNLAHQKLDRAVFAAYGWDANMTDEEILAKLLELNLQRPAYQPKLDGHWQAE